MQSDIKAVAKMAASTLSNISVVGFGLAIFDQRWWCIVISVIAFSAAAFIEWRAEQ